MRNALTTLLILLLMSGCAHQQEDNMTENSFIKTKGEGHMEFPTVEVMRLVASPYHHEIATNGKITAREKVDVNFLSQGVISDIFVKNGQRVAKGQKLASIDAFRLKNQLEKNRNAMESASLELQDVLIGQGYDPEYPERVPEDVMRLARLRSGLEQAELSYEASKRDMEDAILTAPICGVVANLTAKQHNQTSTLAFCRIIDDSKMEVEFSVIESELAMLKQGDEVMVTPYSDYGIVTTGRITEINPMIDDNGMVKIWAAVDGRKGLIDGMNVKVRIRREAENALVLPKRAVVMRNGKKVVFTLKNNKAIWNYVTTGLENLDQVTILDGLAEGDTVIINGNIDLAHESSVRTITDKKK